MIVLNNLFLNSTELALKNVDANSMIAYNLFWNNKANSEGSNIVINTNLFSDPMLNESGQPQAGSPAIDAGTADFEWKGEVVLELESNSYSGEAPDLGASETDFSIPLDNSP